MMPLTMCKAGEENEIKKIGGKEETRRHLENLGFVVGGKFPLFFNICTNEVPTNVLFVPPTWATPL